MNTLNNEESPNYYAIIPANVRYDDLLCANAKLLYGEITALCSKEGYCWAGNDYFAKKYKTTKKTISRWINSLKDRGYIKVRITYKENTKEVDKRLIIISNSYPIDEKVNTSCQKSDYPIDKKEERCRQKSKYPMDKKVIDNNININNINYKLNYIYSRVIDYLNQKTSKNFKSTTQKTKKLIQARINDGFSLEDFKKVIDTKTKEWINDKTMSRYLRPETLFGNKFEGYLNEVIEHKVNEEDNSFEEYKELEKRFSHG